MRAELQPHTGACRLDRDFAVTLRINEEALETLDQLAKESSRNTVIEAAMRSHKDGRSIPYHMAIIDNENKKYPADLVIEEAVKTLSVEEAYQHLDPQLKRLSPKEDIMEGLAAIVPLTLETLQHKENDIIEDNHQREMNEADRKATFFKGDALSGFIKVSRNEVRYAEEVKRISQRRDRADRERAYHRENRDRILATAAMLLQKQLRQPGIPQTHRQYEAPSAFATEGGATRIDRAEAERALRKRAPS